MNFDEWFQSYWENNWVWFINENESKEEAKSRMKEILEIPWKAAVEQTLKAVEQEYEDMQ